MFLSGCGWNEATAEPDAPAILSEDRLQLIAGDWSAHFDTEPGLFGGEPDPLVMCTGEMEVFEKKLMRLVERQLSDFGEYPELRSVLKNQNNKWRVVSGVQKAIRRGDAATARKTAHALYAGEQKAYLWQRLCVIALEDTSIAAPWECAIALLAGKSKTWRDKVGERKLLLYVVTLLANAPKDRSACDVMCYLMFTNAVKDLKGVDTWDHDTMMRVALDRNASLLQRTAALWLLRGTASLECGGLPSRSGDSDKVMEVMEKLQTPDLIQYLVHRGMRSVRYGLFFPIPFLWNHVCRSETFQFDEEVIAPSHFIKKLPEESYDQHTQDGKRALAYFSKTCDPVREFFEKHPTLDKVKCLGSVLFICEGAILNRYLMFDDQPSIYRTNVVSDCIAAGLPEKHIEALVEMVNANRPLLRKARERVIS